MAKDPERLQRSQGSEDSDWQEFLEFVVTSVELGKNDPPPEELMERDGRPTLSPDGTS